MVLLKNGERIVVCVFVPIIESKENKSIPVCIVQQLPLQLINGNKLIIVRDEEVNNLFKSLSCHFQ